MEFHIDEEGCHIAKTGRSGKPPLNPIQWNAFAIVFVLAFMPFAIAFITNAGSDADGEYEDSLPSMDTYGNAGGGAAGSYWINNGGENHTAEYVANDPTIAGTYYENCAYVVDGYCVGFAAPPTALNRMPLNPFNNLGTNDWSLPMLSTWIQGSHYQADPSGSYFFGSSGDGPFTMLFNDQYLLQVENGESIDSLRFTFVNDDVSYACDWAGFVNVSFTSEITFYYGNDTLTFDDFNFEMMNRYSYRGYDRQNNHWTDFCKIGLQVEYDFRGYESLVLSTFNRDDWRNTTFQLNFDNFENTDSTVPFGDTAIPFSCNCRVALGVEHQPINTIVAGFIIRTGTLFLAAATFAMAIASTRQWNPFTTFIGGLLP